MEKLKEISKHQFNLQEKIDFAISEKYLESYRNLSQETIQQIDFNNLESVKDFFKEFIDVFKNEDNNNHITKSFSKEIIYEFLKQRSANELLENPEINPIFLEALQVNNHLQNS